MKRASRRVRVAVAGGLLLSTLALSACRIPLGPCDILILEPTSNLGIECRLF